MQRITPGMTMLGKSGQLAVPIVGEGRGTAAPTRDRRVTGESLLCLCLIVSCGSFPL